MKKLIVILTLFCANFLFAQTEWHVRPMGPLSNDGASTHSGTSVNDPWDLQTALTQLNTVVKPGDIVWLHDGVYRGHYRSTLTGTGFGTGQFITVAEYPGEQATIDGNIHNGAPFTFPTNQWTDYQDFIFSVAGGYTIFKDFEITCLGEFSRISSLNGCTGYHFKEYAGIYHNSPIPSKFVNLIVRNIPGIAFASWKTTADTEMYGCLMYFNGVILPQTGVCNNFTTHNSEGYQHNIYTQNETNVYRSFRHNIFANNYAEGLSVWSASTDSYSFTKNYNISSNVFINNSSPVRDDTQNLQVKTVSPTNKPDHINIFDNLLYVNNISNYVAGMQIENAVDVNIYNNYIFNGNVAGFFTQPSTNTPALTNHRINFHHNVYVGKYMCVYETAANFNASGNAWSFHDNKYFINQGLVTQTGKMFRCMPTTFGVVTDLTFAEFQTAYANGATLAESGSEYHCQSYSGSGDCYGVCSYNCSGMPAQRTWIHQNEYNPRVFYVSIYNPQNPNVGTHMNVDFSNWTIPTNNDFVVRDAENYFVPISIGTNLINAAHTIDFPLPVTAPIEQILPLPGSSSYGPAYVPGDDSNNPTGIPLHSKNDLRTFIVEFPCKTPFDLVEANKTDAAYQFYMAQHDITFGPAYIAAATATIEAKAGRQVRLLPGTTIQSGAAVHAYISNSTCPQILELEEGKNAQSSDAAERQTDEIGQDFAIYPNPSAGIFKVESKSAKITNIEIIGTETAKSIFTYASEGRNEIDVDIAKSNPGIYIVKVTFDSGETQSKTIIKQ
jgi:hypothetical protein